MLSPQAVNRFFNYVNERECVRLRKAAGEPFPWTDDVILQRYKFTNVRRFHDKTTQAFLKIYNGGYKPCKKHSLSRRASLLVNCATFRYFGTVLFAQYYGWHDIFWKSGLLAAAKRCIKAKKQIFTGAYVITNGGIAEPKEDVVIKRYLAGLAPYAECIVNCMDVTHTWKAGCNRLREVEGFGGTGFMAKEVLQDYLMLCPQGLADVGIWSPAGPGARHGLNRLYDRPLEHTQSDDDWSMEIFDLWTPCLELWRRYFPKDKLELTASDIQFCLCEFDKYERVRLNEGRPRSRYKPAIQQLEGNPLSRNGIEVF
jgi:hypothetical protein